MIDFHTHILPHIDDGAKDSKMAVQIMENARSQGVTDILFTPHYYGKRRNPVRFLEKRAEAFATLQGKIPDGVRVYLGAEVHFTGMNMPDFDELAKLSIEDTKYILFELPFTTKWNSFLIDTIREFIDETDYTPIIAHVERYEDVLKRPSLVTDFIRMGCLIQVNTHAFLNKREKGFAFTLLKHGLIHCLGTDTHDNDSRAPDYAQAKEVVEQAGFAEEWGKIQQNMRTILDGGNVQVEQGKPVKKFFGKYF